MKNKNSLYLNKKGDLPSSLLIMICLSLILNMRFSSVLFSYGCRSYDDFRAYDSPYYEIDEPFEASSIDTMYRDSQSILDAIEQALTKEDLKTVRQLHYSLLKIVRAIPSKSKGLSQKKYVHIEQTANEIVSTARKLHRVARQNGDKAIAFELLSTLNAQFDALKAYYPESTFSEKA